MRRPYLAPLLILIGSCANQEPIYTSSPVPEAAPVLTDGVPLVELDYGRFQILYD